jgi:hypothetical protein
MSDKQAGTLQGPRTAQSHLLQFIYCQLVHLELKPQLAKVGKQVETHDDNIIKRNGEYKCFFVNVHSP